MKWIFYSLGVFLLIGCSNTDKTTQESESVQNSTSVKSFQKVNVCDKIDDNTKLFNTSLQDTNTDLNKTVNQYYKINNQINENNCKVAIKDDDLKSLLVNNFIALSQEKHDEYIQEVNQLFLDIFKLHEENLLSIASSYSEEMNDISLFTTDEENWEQYLETPLREEVGLINNEFLYEIDNYRLDLLVQNYKNFINFSETYNFAFSAESDPNYETKIKTDFSIKYIDIDKSDEDILTSSIVNVVTETSDFVLGDTASLVIDGLDIATRLLDIKIRGDKNFIKANNYINLIITDYQNEKLSEVKQDIDEQEKYLKQYFKNMIIMEKIK